MNDELMQQIIDIKNDYIVEPVSATIDDNNIIPGLVGKEVDVDKTYSNMKRLGDFDKSLIIYKDILPAITVGSDYDKYIISGNPNRQDVAFIFRLNGLNYLEEVLKILEDNQIEGLFMVDSNLIFNDVESIVEIINDKHLIVPAYNEDYLLSFDMLNSIDNKLKYYCVTVTDNQDLLDICNKSKRHTIRPSIVINSHPYFEIKNSLTNGSIIYVDVNSKLLKELSPVIKYINQKGFNIVRLDNIISETN
jgi:peptidoglycan-N-acetylglucosamine deacetylase